MVKIFSQSRPAKNLAIQLAEKVAEAVEETTNKYDGSNRATAVPTVTTAHKEGKKKRLNVDALIRGY